MTCAVADRQSPLTACRGDVPATNDVGPRALCHLAQHKLYTQEVDLVYQQYVDKLQDVFDMYATFEELGASRAHHRPPSRCRWGRQDAGVR